MLGYDSAEGSISAITDTARQVWMNPQDRSRCLRLLDVQETVRNYECRLKRKDNSAIWPRGPRGAWLITLSGPAMEATLRPFW